MIRVKQGIGIDKLVFVSCGKSPVFIDPVGEKYASLFIGTEIDRESETAVYGCDEAHAEKDIKEVSVKITTHII